MKGRFSTLDILAIVPELRESLVGLRVQQIYDVNNKTYLIRFCKNSKQDGKVEAEELSKTILLLESGIRLHLTEYNWSKNMTPSGFTMKLRKHLNNKRLESITQVGIDRIVDMKFGAGEFCFHVIIELYDKGNLVITDKDYVILNVLRPRKAGVDEDVKYMVKERYPLEVAQKESDVKLPEVCEIKEILMKAKPGDNLRKVFNPKVVFGPALLEHSFIDVQLPENIKIKELVESDCRRISDALQKALTTMKNVCNSSSGYIIQQEEERVVKENSIEDDNPVISYIEFHPMLFHQHKNSSKVSYVEMETFNRAVDVYFSSIESQKIDRKALHAEKEAVKKLENVKKDHEKRLKELAELQEADKRKAGLIEMNSEIVEKALLVIRSAVANQMSWDDIKEMVEEAQKLDDPIANRISKLSLEQNRFTMMLSDPYDKEIPDEKVEIDLGLSSFANARRYYTMKRHAQKKEQKTVESSSKALKSAEIKTKQALKEVAIKTSITKARKVLWFEKFFWFISSDKYLVIAGRDAQQNELIVKKHLKPGDVYVHAEVHGASSVVVKSNDPAYPIPPKTLEEAGTMAVCYSSAWEAKVVPRAWYVFHNQVSKTAPTGEYLTVGSFMIRGKKNYLPLTQLILGFGFLFRLDEESTLRRLSEEPVENVSQQETEDTKEVELAISDSEDESKPDEIDHEKVVNEDETLVEEESTENLILKPKATRVKSQQKLRSERDRQVKKAKAKIEAEFNQLNSNQPLKRGQKGKLKKLKEKYKDQDDEERQLRMAILGSVPSGQNKKKYRLMDLTVAVQNMKLSKADEKSEETTVEPELASTEVESDHGKEPALNAEAEPEMVLEQVVESEEDDEESSASKANENRSIIRSLTEQPRADDNLFYTIPVVGPYSALVNYKFKVKVLPGMSKRGKAAKTSLNYFLNDKTCTQREKDLLKSSKDQDVSRNIPNKVKISAQNLIAVKRKK